MRMLNRILLMLCFVGIMCSIMSCSKTPEKAIIGKWEVVISNIDDDLEDQIGSIWEFHKNGNLTIILDDGLEPLEYLGSYIVGTNSNNIIIQLPDEFFFSKEVNETVALTGFITEISKKDMVLDLVFMYEPWHLEFERTDKSIQTMEEKILGTWEVVDCYFDFLGNLEHIESEYGNLYEFDSSHKIRIQDNGTGVIQQGTYSLVGDELSITINGRTHDNKIDYLSSTRLKLTEPITDLYNSRCCEFEKTTKPLDGQNFSITVTADPREGGTVSGGGIYQTGQQCTLTAMANAGYTFANWTENGNQVSINANYTFTVTGNRVLVANFTQNGGGGDHAYIDLGLPSGLLWASCNVGADNPEDYGDYFAWGETQPKDTYNWSTYQYANGTSWQDPQLTKYCDNSNYGYNGFTDNLTTLLPEDDAATANWGNSWRMPTKEEWQELYNNTTVTWTIQNGVNGRLFTASNGNSLFLPAAGCRYESSLLDAGSYGYYWSSSLSTEDPYGAWSLYFGSGGCSMNGISRSNGPSVRPVRSALQN